MKKYLSALLALAAIATQFYPDHSEKKTSDSRRNYSSNAAQAVMLNELLGE